MKFNFLIITSSYPTISGESFEGACVEIFAQALAHLGNNVTILTQCVNKNYYKDSDSLSLRRFEWSSQVKPLSTLKVTHDFGKICLYFSKGLHEANEIIREQQIDLTICAWALPSGLFGLYLKKRYRIPYVIWALGSDIWNHSTSLLSRPILRNVLNHALNIYADGYSLKEEIHQIIAKNVSFLPTSRILPKVVNPCLTLNPDQVHFLFVGRYHVNKGPDILVETIHLLSPDLQKHSYFHFFGLGEMKEHLESLVEKYQLHHCMSLNGPVNIYKLSKYLELVDYIIIPSRVESIPVILSDALQKQCSIIATNVGDMGALLTEYKIGRISQKANPDSLSEILSEAIVEQDSEAGRMQELYHLFDPDINARNFVKDVERLLNTHA